MQCDIAYFKELLYYISYTILLYFYQLPDMKPRVTLTRTPEYDLMHTEDSVSFICHINVSTGWEYQWYKDDRGIASEDNHTISSVTPSDSGLYKCQVKRGKAFESDKSPALELKVKGQFLFTSYLHISVRGMNLSQFWLCFLQSAHGLI